MTAMGSVWAARAQRVSKRARSFWRRRLNPAAPWCNVCGYCGEFRDPTNGANLRESLICGLCGSRSRDRMLIYSLGRALEKKPPLRNWPANRSLRVLETTGHGGHPFFLTKKFDYYNPRYDPDQIAAGADPRKFADVQALPYGNEFFDCALSSDVFEHVRLDQNGFSEIYRVLKPGGVFVLQAPYIHTMEKTHILVEPRGDEDAYLEPPQYHAGHTLVYRIYGRDLLARLEGHGFSTEHSQTEIAQHRISLQDVFVATKPGSSLV